MSDEKKTESTSDEDAEPKAADETDPKQRRAVATFGNGCFWCTEAVFLRLRGVESVKPGYSGGRTKNPTYEEICTGRTGHAEVIQIVFDPAEISYRDLLDVFFHTHDPTTLNRQGNDVGTQYRSVVFFHDEQQQQEAEEMIKQLTAAEEFDDPIVTEVTELDRFYPAEKYHENYFAQNPGNPYCMFQVGPKVRKFQQRYKGLLKKEEDE